MNLTGEEHYAMVADRNYLKLAAEIWFHRGGRQTMPHVTLSRLAICTWYCGVPPVVPQYDHEKSRRLLSAKYAPPSVRKCEVCNRTHRTSDDCPVADRTLTGPLPTPDLFDRPFGTKLVDAEMMNGMVTA